jgi:hypothetical protein
MAAHHSGPHEVLAGTRHVGAVPRLASVLRPREDGERRLPVRVHRHRHRPASPHARPVSRENGSGEKQDARRIGVLSGVAC